MSESDLTVAIVNYNSTDFLRDCLESLYRESAKYLLRVVVVDNASTDSDFTQIQKQFPKVTLLRNSINLGFARASNQALLQGSSPFYLLLNPDVRILEGAVDRCLDQLSDDPEIGILGSRIEHPDGSLQLASRRSIPTPASAFYRFAGLSRLFPRSPRFGRYNLTFLSEDSPHEVGAVSGAFMMFRREVLEELGGLDETFFLYGEDLDFCHRARQRGWKVLFFPHARVLHFKRRSSSRNAAASLGYFYQSMEIFFRKHYAPRCGRIQWFLVLTGIRLFYRLAQVRMLLGDPNLVGSKR